MRHDRRHVAVWLEAGEHVLHEHQISLLAGLGANHIGSGSGISCPGPAVVLRERRVGQHAVELAECVQLNENLRVLQRVGVLRCEARDVVEDHVHDADRPDRAVRVLAVKREVVGIVALFFDVLMDWISKPPEPTVGS